MVKLKVAIALSAMIFPTFVFAQWVTKTDDDIFTGGKKATMIATIGEDSDSSALIFDCTKNNLVFSYIEKSSDPDKVSNIPVDMFVKVDSGDIIKTKSAFSQRNDQYIQASISDIDLVTEILKESSKAKSKIIIGISNDIIGQNSVSASMAGSGKAVGQFVSACEINIK
ncbi:hypothetical protein [Rouxiella sp. WC2420]|uniref:Uncharacterized protein n=1 Tax=Rouxiella sp. WC2420 TaxID=3234145 RepID=A0AB39VQQ4_9GAMM